jgi:type IV secretory pathway VirB2 component (pilin)
MTNTFKIDSDFIWKSLLLILFACMVTTNFDVALASSDSGSSSDNNDAIGEQLCNIVQSLQGGIAKSVATIAIIGVAGGLLLGKLNWVVAMTVSVGVIIIFSAGKIVGFVSGDGQGITGDTTCSDLQ